MPPNATIKPRRAWRKFSVRGLMLLVLILAVWLGDQVAKVRKQAAAVASIRRLGGGVSFDYQTLPSGNMNMSAEPPGPRWLRELLAPDYFRTAWHVGIYGDAVGDADLAFLGDLPDLVSLGLQGTKLADRGMSGIGSMKRLKRLILTETSVDDDCLRHLEGSRRLTNLHLRGTRVTDAGLVHLAGLKNLRILVLSDLPISDDGLAHLASLDRLEHLDLAGTKVTGVGLERISGLKNLRSIRIGRGPLKAEDVRKSLPGVKHVDAR